MNNVALGAEEVAAKDFPVAFRGFAQHEVRAFLAQVAAELAAARERERLQRERLEAAETRASARALSDEEIEAALGHEAGRVLQAAREAAAEIRSRAEEQVARLVRDASGEGSRAHLEAESLLALRTEEAERIAVEIQAQAQAAAEDVLEEAKGRGREMVAEAQTVRERVLKDLARRRRVAHQQLEQLRVGRERLLEAYRVVRTTLDEATRELSVAEAEARAAAETAALRVGSQREPTVEELEAELLGARDIGLAPAPVFVSRPPMVNPPVVEAVVKLEPVAPVVVGAETAASRAKESEAAPPEVEGESEPEAESEPEVVSKTAPDGESPEPEPARPGPADTAVAVEAGDESTGNETASNETAGNETASSEKAVAEPAVVEPAVVEDAAPKTASSETDVTEEATKAQAAERVDDERATTEAGNRPLGTEPALAEPTVVKQADIGKADTGQADTGPDEGQRAQHDVEDLFARLRAERAATVARAEAVLAAAPPSEVSEAVASTNGRAPSPTKPIEPAPSPSTTDDEDLLQARDAELEAVERSLVKALKRTLVDEQNEVLDVLRRKGGAVPLAELLPGASDHTARYLAVVGPELRAGAASGAGDQHDPPPVDDLAVGLATEVTGDLRDRIQRALESADGDVTPVVDTISSAYREWKTTKAEPLSRHHASAAHCRGRFAVAKAGTLRWVVDGEEGPCPDCDDNALAGAIAKGETFPTGQLHPPAHLGCRCTIAVMPTQ